VRLSDIRKNAPQVWHTSKQFISYPELMQALDPESVAVSTSQFWDTRTQLAATTHNLTQLKNLYFSA